MVKILKEKTNYVKMSWVLDMNIEEILKDYYNETEEKMRLRLLDLMLLDYEEVLDMILKNIKESVELRSNAYALNVLSKKKKVKEYLEEHFTLATLMILINSDDSKVRKNTYILLGNIVDAGYEKFLLDALDNETVNFCIPSIVLSLGNYKIDNINEILENKRREIEEKYRNKEIEISHFKEISASIRKVLLKNIEFNKHEFIGFSDKRDVLLTVMKALKNCSLNDIKAHFKNARSVDDGVLISTNDYNSIFKIRTFYEALLCDKENFNLNKEEINDYIVNVLNSGFISSCHRGETPFYYRIEIKSTMNKKKKLELIESVKNSIDEELNGEYINNPSLYEFEIRIVENEDKFKVFFKLFTVEDDRYSYRVTDLPASINPTTAAILMQEIKGYLKDNSEVCDAFCGTSTVLLERSFIKGYKSLTGIDISKEAIEFSKINANNVPVKIDLVCEDIIKYNGPEFDEIISNMPFGNRVSNHELNETLYRRFIAKLDTMLKQDGHAFLLTSEIALMKKLINKNNNLKLVKNIYVESGGLKPHLFIIKKVC